MTDEEINIEIAKSRGYSRHYFNDSSPYAKEKYWMSPNGGVTTKIPNYCNDLNATRDLEMSLTKEQRMTFRRKLSHLARKENPSAAYGELICHATAKLRCEAYIATLEFWNIK